DRIERHPPAELAGRADALLAKWFHRRPKTNPLVQFGNRFGGDVDALKREGLAAYHAYAFATIRQCGANFELTAAFLRWLEQHRPVQGGAYERAAAHFEAISNGSKTLILKAARAVGGNKTVDFGPMIDEMAKSWDAAMTELGT